MSQPFIITNLKRKHVLKISGLLTTKIRPLRLYPTFIDHQKYALYYNNNIAKFEFFSMDDAFIEENDPIDKVDYVKFVDYLSSMTPLPLSRRIRILTQGEISLINELMKDAYEQCKIE